jgi:hypothetical protein
MRIRLLQTVTGSFYNIDGGIPAGTVVDVDEDAARRCINNGSAAPVDDEAQAEESAVLDEPQAESAVAKRPARRTRKKKPPPKWHDEDAPGWNEVEQR